MSAQSLSVERSERPRAAAMTPFQFLPNTAFESHVEQIFGGKANALTPMRPTRLACLRWASMHWRATVVMKSTGGRDRSAALMTAQMHGVFTSVPPRPSRRRANSVRNAVLPMPGAPLDYPDEAAWRWLVAHRTGDGPVQETHLRVPTHEHKGLVTVLVFDQVHQFFADVFRNHGQVRGVLASNAANHITPDGEAPEMPEQRDRRPGHRPPLKSGYAFAPWVGQAAK